MTPAPTYDVAVVGASIAGCTAAILFARQGLSVALIERHAAHDAYKRICTHFIQASAAPTIDRLGLAKRLEEAGAVRSRLQLWTRWGWIKHSPGSRDSEPTCTYNIRRQTLDPILRGLAVNTPGVVAMLGSTAEGLVREQDRCAGVLVRDRDGQKREVTARLVVAADGRDSQIAQFAQAPAQIKPNQRCMYFAYYRHLPLATGADSLFWMLDPDVAYALPNDEGITLVACFVTKDKLPAFRADRRGSLTRFFERLPSAPDIACGEPVSEVLGAIDLPNKLRPAAWEGIAFVGDAALATDPLWGVGCGWAFQSAEWLVDSTVDALRSGARLEGSLASYRRRHRNALAGHHFLIADYAVGRPFNPVERLYFSAAAKDERLADLVLAFGSRRIGPGQLLGPVPLCRAIWTHLRSGKNR